MKGTDVENKTATYFTLKYEFSDSFHRKGEVVVIPSGELSIGQQDDCKVWFKNHSDFEDEQYAIIRPTRNEGEWQLVPTSEHTVTSVNGIPVKLVHYMNNGDRITFDQEEQELLFTIHHDDKYDPQKGIQVITAPLSKRLLAFIIAMPLLLLSLFIGYIIKDGSAEKERTKLLGALKTSVLQICIDSVMYVEKTSAGEAVLRTYSYQNGEGCMINGTAFLTTDSSIITARHCIEPWLNDPTIDEANTIDDVKSMPSKWVMEAETYNQTHESDTVYKVISICKFYRGANGTEKFGRDYLSSEFVVDDTRDNIIEKGDYRDVYYWRSIKETYSNKEMMFGDVAWAAADSVGKIILANEEEIEKLLANSPELYFMGYPDYNTMQGLSMTEGRMQMEYVKGNVIAHDGNLIHGYSGAPAIVIDSNKAYAVGVVSRLDAKDGRRTYSIPINQLKKKGVKK